MFPDRFEAGISERNTNLVAVLRLSRSWISKGDNPWAYVPEGPEEEDAVEIGRRPRGAWYSVQMGQLGLGG